MPTPAQIVNGVPVNPDVQRLLDAFPGLDAQRGRVILHHLLARVLYVPGVMAAVSRRELLRIGLYIHCLPTWADEVKP